MHVWSADGPFERVASVVPGLVHLRAVDAHLDVFVEGARTAGTGPPVPPRVSGVRIERDPAAPGAVTLSDAAGTWRVAARSWRVHQPRPELFVAPLARFAPTPKEERTIRWLLRLLRIPGVTRLIRLWHAWRTK